MSRHVLKAVSVVFFFISMIILIRYLKTSNLAPFGIFSKDLPYFKLLLHFSTV